MSFKNYVRHIFIVLWLRAKFWDEKERVKEWVYIREIERKSVCKSECLMRIFGCNVLRKKAACVFDNAIKVGIH